MAIYNANFGFLYTNTFGAGDLAKNVPSFGQGSFAINDSEANNTFETDDAAITVTGSGVNHTYAGTIDLSVDIGGGNYQTVEFVVLQQASPETNYLLYANIPGSVDGNAVLSSLPNSITLATDVNTAAFEACFAAGTLIATARGEVAVETLAIGDLVLTADGRAVSVRWLGRQTAATAFMDAVSRPVRIAAGALGERQPARDLCVTRQHALLLDGMLVNAGALVNGTTIRRMTTAELGQSFTVYQIETADHELILAEGLPAETFLDHVPRSCFDNAAEYEALFGGTDTTIREMDLPRAASARQVPATIRDRIAAIAATRMPEPKAA